mmetsp:Transcript_40477/g.128994  ORF Transcript_40477/g.128994 Transcript_40477/m.128994 type:complete len:535 (+) Transcript_40477:421-2025(+)
MRQTPTPPHLGADGVIFGELLLEELLGVRSGHELGEDVVLALFLLEELLQARPLCRHPLQLLHQVSQGRSHCPLVLDDRYHGRRETGHHGLHAVNVEHAQRALTLLQALLDARVARRCRSERVAQGAGLLAEALIQVRALRARPPLSELGSHLGLRCLLLVELLVCVREHVSRDALELQELNLHLVEVPQPAPLVDLLQDHFDALGHADGAPDLLPVKRVEDVRELPLSQPHARVVAAGLELVALLADDLVDHVRVAAERLGAVVRDDVGEERLPGLQLQPRGGGGLHHRCTRDVREARGVRDLGEVDVLVLSGGAVVGAGQRRVQRLDSIAARQHAFGRLHALERRGKDGLGVVEAGDLLPDLLRVVEPLRRGSLRYGLLPRREFEEFERPVVRVPPCFPPYIPAWRRGSLGCMGLGPAACAMLRGEIWCTGWRGGGEVASATAMLRPSAGSPSRAALSASFHFHALAEPAFAEGIRPRGRKTRTPGCNSPREERDIGGCRVHRGSASTSKHSSTSADASIPALCRSTSAAAW